MSCDPGCCSDGCQGRCEVEREVKAQAERALKERLQIVVKRNHRGYEWNMTVVGYTKRANVSTRYQVIFVERIR